MLKRIPRHALMTNCKFITCNSSLIKDKLYCSGLESLSETHWIDVVQTIELQYEQELNLRKYLIICVTQLACNVLLKI